MATGSIFSSDTHVVEPPDLWATRIDQKFRDRAPYVTVEEDGDWLYCDGLRISTVVGALAGERFVDPQKMARTPRRYEGSRLGVSDVAAHVKDMDADGVAMEILYPSLGLTLYGVPDVELRTAICRTYNDWVAEWSRPYSHRIKPVAVLNTDDIEVAVAELQRCAQLGMKAACMPIKPAEHMTYDSSIYDRLWAAAQDLQIPLSMHSSTIRYTSLPSGTTSIGGMSRGWGTTSAGTHASDVLHDMIFSGVFERFPNLKIGVVETHAGWAPFFVRQMDFAVTKLGTRSDGQRMYTGTPYKVKGNALPSDFIRQNIFFGITRDVETCAHLKETLGVETLTFGNDYPHTDGTFPKSLDMLDAITVGCTTEEKRKIARDNVARIYDLGST